MNVRTGLEVFLEDPPSWVRGRRLGLLCNQASVDTLLRHSKDLIFSTMLPGQLKCLFSPQHGLYAEKQDNMKESPDDFAQTLNIPVFSLYGKDREPSPDQLSGIDLLVVDLQDVGCRVYTFIWTLYLAMKACAKAGVGIAVLDRPNPLGGEVIEGNLLARDCRSFVGLAPLPMRHGMTIGEIAGFFMEEQGLDLEFHIVKMQGWSREMDFAATGLPWIWPSPNMPTLDTATVYPGQVVWEGTNVSEGRGTTRPFEIFGAPFLDPDAVRKEAEKWSLPGFILREQSFEPAFHKWSGKRCRGFQIHVTNRLEYRPYITTLAVLAAVKRMHPKDFAWKDPPYEYEFERLPADLIIGDKRVREALDAGTGPMDIQSVWARDLKDFEQARPAWLLYP
ncbi:MAG: DUF1343 domain-containing protein [Thermodesulfobacteriota bacterium]|nr:MAG: DUF1343 domain-containing protein [Thermodesulfobacteriota bacterium]